MLHPYLPPPPPFQVFLDLCHSATVDKNDSYNPTSKYVLKMTLIHLEHLLRIPVNTIVLQMKPIVRHLAMFVHKI